MSGNVRPAPPGPPGLVNTVVFALPLNGTVRLTAMVMVLPLPRLCQSIGAVKLPHSSRSKPGSSVHFCHLISWLVSSVLARACGATSSVVATVAAAKAASCFLMTPVHRFRCGGTSPEGCRGRATCGLRQDAQ